MLCSLFNLFPINHLSLSAVSYSYLLPRLFEVFPSFSPQCTFKLSLSSAHHHRSFSYSPFLFFTTWRTFRAMCQFPLLFMSSLPTPPILLAEFRRSNSKTWILPTVHILVPVGCLQQVANDATSGQPHRKSKEKGSNADDITQQFFPSSSMFDWPWRALYGSHFHLITIKRGNRSPKEEAKGRRRFT